MRFIGGHIGFGVLGSIRVYNAYTPGIVALAYLRVRPDFCQPTVLGPLVIPTVWRAE